MERCAREVSRLNAGGRWFAAEVRDCLFLAALVAASVVLYTPHLGFYSDDWAFLRILETTPDRSYVGLVRGLYDADVFIKQRPVQVAYLASAYAAFGLDPLGYHVVNAVALAAAVILVYLVLQELRQPRMLALAVASVYGVMPNFSSDRFWIAAHQATLSVLFLLVSTLAALRTLRAGILGVAVGTFVSVVALILSGLAYEVTIPMLALALALVAYRAYRLGLLADSTRRRRVLTLVVLNGAALAGVIAFKAQQSVRVGVDQPYGDYLVDLVLGTLRVDLGVYGGALPYVLGWILVHASDALVLVLGAAVAAAVSAYVWRLKPRRVATGRAAAIRYLLGGFATLAVGYAIFLVPTVISFSSASLGNRIRIAAALGAAAMLVGALVLMASFVRAAAARGAVFAAALGILCGTGFIVTNTLARYWVSAYDAQQALVDRLVLDLGDLPSAATVIIDGVCLERGGAYLFTGHRDVTGVLTVRYRRAQLRGSAITNSPVVAEEGLIVRTVGAPDVFPYGDRLIVYDAARRRVHTLVNRKAAERYFTASFRPESDCPPGFAWRGNAPAGS